MPSSRRRSPLAALGFRLVIVAALVQVVANRPANRTSAATPTRESQITAVFLYNFAQFVEWPADAFPDPNAPLEIGVVSADSGVADSLVVAVDGESVAGHPPAVRRFATPADARACHVLYVEGVPPADVDRLIERFRKAPVLTVGNSTASTSSAETPAT